MNTAATKPEHKPAALTAPRAAYRPIAVAAMLDVGLTVARQLIRTGELRSIRIGRAVLVPHEELQRFISARRAAT